jgi:hypothetical protein
MFDQLQKDFAELTAAFKEKRYADVLRESADLMEDCGQLCRRGADLVDAVTGPFKLGAAGDDGDVDALYAQIDELELAVRPALSLSQAAGDPPADPNVQITPMVVITIVSALIALWRKLKPIIRK